MKMPGQVLKSIPDSAKRREELQRFWTIWGGMVAKSGAGGIGPDSRDYRLLWKAGFQDRGLKRPSQIGSEETLVEEKGRRLDTAATQVTLQHFNLTGGEGIEGHPQLP